MTVPSKVATLASVQPARIARMEVAEGAVVKQGDLVVALDDGVQRVRDAMARAKAESTLEIGGGRPATL